MGKQTARKRILSDIQDLKWKARLKKDSEERAKDVKKKKSYKEMLKHFDFPEEIKDYIIRNPEEWKAKSFNFDKQCKSFIDHLFVKYEVPGFMYQIFQTQLNMIRRHEYRSRWGVAREVKRPDLWTDETILAITWFMCLAQGGSFHKEIKGILTKKEALTFLSGENELSINDNILLAKCRVVGLRDSISKHIMRVLFSSLLIVSHSFNSKRFLTTINFYSNIQEYLDDNTLTEVTDYIRSAFSRDFNFSLKGRTITSIINLSNEWHRQQAMTSKATRAAIGSWEGLNITDWKLKTKDDDRIWTITQIKTAKDLTNEGRKQRHCVWSYCRSCASGNIAIFTMESDTELNYEKKKHITIEVGKDKRIYQMRGRLNRAPNNNELKIIKRWAFDRALIF